MDCTHATFAFADTGACFAAAGFAGALAAVLMVILGVGAERGSELPCRDDNEARGARRIIEAADLAFDLRAVLYACEHKVIFRCSARCCTLGERYMRRISLTPCLSLIPSLSS